MMQISGAEVPTAPSSDGAFFPDPHGQEPIRAELYGCDRLESHARQLAAQATAADVVAGQPLLARFQRNSQALRRAHRYLSEAQQRRETFGSAAEWLLDNFHIIADALAEIRTDLPGGYYKLLPKLTRGPLAGFPRVYALALELVAHSDSCLDETNITCFVQAYQTVTPLTIGEVWAIPIMLRVIVIENLHRLAEQVVDAHRQRHAAKAWIKPFLANPSSPPAPASEHGGWKDSFIVHVLELLRDHGAVRAAGLEWLENALAQHQETSTEILQREQRRQAANQVSIGNGVTSLRLLSALDWTTFFERTSVVEALLRRDPAGVYGEQDFPTRDRYRRVIEKLARGSQRSEWEVAQQVLDLADRAAEPQAPSNHVGYYLIDEGRAELDARLPYHPALADRVQRALLRHPQLVYFGGLGLVTVLLLGGMAAYGLRHTAAESALLLGVLVVVTALLPASELAIGIVNYLVTLFVPPRVLPKRALKEGIPPDCATFVVMPCMLMGPESAASLLRRLEIHYLSNPDDVLRFALLTDFADAPQERMPEDEQYVQTALAGIKKLNDRYAAGGPERFFLCHRRRVWNPVQGCWMGWERKRGKLIEFNRLMRGDRATSYTVLSPGLERLPQIRYVITLDADTQLPRETARRLIATLSHPLNKPVQARGHVVRGYGILQPRVSVTLLAAAKSLFARIYAGSAGIDPYTTAVSDTYQDLFGIGSFTGKGIYDLDAFDATAGRTFPDNQILSHDLIEGNYARCGLVTDIELLDEFPSQYRAYGLREHRWARGDWQILPWLFAQVPAPEGGKRPNVLPAVERWKIFDNLRRSLLPPALLVLLVLGWTILPGAPLAWTLFVLLVLGWPLVLQAARGSVQWLHGLLRHGQVRGIPGGMGATAAQALLSLIFLADQARLLLDAVVRTLVRLGLTRRHLLEWETAAATERRLTSSLTAYCRMMWQAPALAVAAGLGVGFIRPDGLWAAAPILLGWFLSPAVAFWVSRPRRITAPTLTEEDRRQLRLQARKIWNFFETFVGEQDHGLPPDNYQEDPDARVAHRTSPTNIGLYLLSCVAAHDFGYLSLLGLLERLERTFATLDQLERFHGHLQNWYDTRTLRPLPPGFISTVDSGNLLGCLMTLRHGLEEKAAEAVPGPSACAGLRDSLELITRAFRGLELPRAMNGAVLQAFEQLLHEVDQQTCEAVRDLLHWDECLERFERAAEELASHVHQFADLIHESPEELHHWAEAFAQQVTDRRRELANLVPWLSMLRAAPAEFQPTPAQPSSEPSQRWQQLRALLLRTSSIAGWEAQSASVLQELTALEKLWPTPQGREWLTALALTVRSGAAGLWQNRCRRLSERAQALAAAMDFKLLYNESRHLFSVGYNLSLGKLDNAHYDLLASEVRLTSFLAIARGVVPKRHWFQLGRPLTHAAGGVALLSWGGTMFEYLMPRLLLRSFPETLLDTSDRAAVARQIQYGQQTHVPWGISESAYNLLDVELNYQYQAFGVPGLGLKRGLGKDLVVAPYATFLALSVYPEQAAANLRRLAQEGLESTYGYYESVDYTRERLPPKRPFAIVKCYMAHHQGMSMLALANCLLQQPMLRRFHAEPMVRATELLLQERVPQEVPLTEPPHEEPVLPAAATDTLYLLSRRLTTPHTAHPRTHLLSSGEYTVMVTNAGSGRSLCRGLDVNRWREDRTTDSWGQFCYVRDLRTGRLWSAGYQPLGREAQEYEVIFSTDKAEFRRIDGKIETHLEVAVSPENHAEIRRLTLTNHDGRAHDLEVTSYLEIVLGPHAADLAHPAFGKLFLETEFIASEEALLCRRRPRAVKEQPLWGLHVLAVDGPTIDDVQFETDRARFLGRGRTLANPAALDLPGSTGATASKDGPGSVRLSGTTGPVLDPILSLRRKVRVAPGRSVSLAFTTAVTDSREEALALADQYHDVHGVTRGFELAWAHSQVELRHLHLSAEDAHLYQRLAAHLFYTSAALRAPEEVLQANQQGQSGLWRYGISGDNPIVLARLREKEELPLVRELLAAHAYWRLKGLVVDLVLLNEQQTGYFEELQQQIQNLVRASDDRTLLDKPGGVFVRKAAQMPPEDQILLQAAARCILVGDRGTLANQMEGLERPLPRPERERATVRGAVEPEPTPLSTTADSGLLFENGLGGFRTDGSEYVLHLAPLPPTSPNGGRGTAGPEKDQALLWPLNRCCALPPAPWINVVANPNFGFLISESGGGYTWAGNSQTNRLTPWNNDPVSDPPGEVLYVRDAASGEVWTPTPLPIADQAPYTVRHGHGYTIFEHTSHGLVQELVLFVPPEDPIKLISFKVRNTSRRSRRLAVTYYAEWVLGRVRDQAPQQVITEIDPETGALLARNAFSADYPTAVAFADVSLRPRTLTADRTEFLGRNGCVAAPAVLDGTLSGAAGATLDPCAALHTRLDLKPGEEKTVVFFLGQAATVEAVRQLLQRYRQPGQVARVFEEVKSRWQRLLTTLQVSTPNSAFDLLLNRWLLYQVLSCRYWGRSAFYQSGGAFGFRDQLQDVQALVWAAPQITREHILRAAGRQFREGDVQHWWHPPRGAGVRTHISDDYLWLPFVVSHYVQTTGDRAILDESAPFLQAPLLKPDQDDDYRVPEVANESASLYEHCVRALEHGFRFGSHGLPLMGSGDWNDGMNRVGNEGRGESVWNGWFLLTILPHFAALAESRGEAERAQRYQEQVAALRRAIEEQGGWDGQWYRRAYFDDGTPLGSAQNKECRIDSLTQSWAVLSGAADAERARQAMTAAEQQLVRPAEKLILLFTPPFDTGKLEPGYIKGYVPGIRENGGQYTHAATWVVQAFALLGEGSWALALFDLLNPIHHGSTPEEVARYRVEPYVLAGDVYSEPPHTGRGGWTWYTGSAGWLYRVALESILGFHLRGAKLTLQPCIPKSWPGFDVTYRYRSSTYLIRVDNPSGVERGVKEVTLDGKPVADGVIELVDDGRTHDVQVVMG